MNYKNNFIVIGLCLALFFSVTIGIARAQSTTGTGTMSLDQLEQIIISLQKQIAQIIQLLQSRANTNNNVLIHGATPETTTKTFYNWWIDWNVDGGNKNNGQYRRRTELTDSFKAKLDNFVDFDQVVCAQDVPTGLTFSAARTNGSTSIMIVNEEFGSPQARTIPVTVKLIKDSGQWKVNEVICPLPAEGNG